MENVQIENDIDCHKDVVGYSISDMQDPIGATGILDGNLSSTFHTVDSCVCVHPRRR
jgi:hypothetical protein